MMSTTSINSSNHNMSRTAPTDTTTSSVTADNSISSPNYILKHVQNLNNAGVRNFVAGDYIKSIEIFTDCLSIMRCEIQKRAAAARQSSGAISGSVGHDTSSGNHIFNYSHFSYRRVAMKSSEYASESMATSDTSDTTMMDIDAEHCNNKPITASTLTSTVAQTTSNVSIATTSHTPSSQGQSFVFDCPLEVTSGHNNNNTNMDSIEQNWNCEAYETKFLFVILFNLALSHQVFGMNALPRQTIAHRDSLLRALSLYELTHRMLFQSSESNKDTYFEMIMIVNNLSTILQELGNDDEAKMCHQQLLSAVMLLVDSGEYDVLEEINCVLNNIIPKLFQKSCSSAPAA